MATDSVGQQLRQRKVATAWMVDLAAREETRSYSQMVDELSLGWTPNHPSLIDLLGRVSRKSFERKGVLLSAVIVQSESQRPGEGFFELARSKGIDVTDQRAAWFETVDAVYRAARLDKSPSAWW